MILVNEAMERKKQATTETRLVFVYNADSGLFNTLTDIAHKVFSPATYSCHLCELSHGHFTMRSEWSAFIETLSVEGEYLHRDEFVRQYGHKDLAFPAVFTRSGNDIDLCVDAKTINNCNSIDELKSVINQHCIGNELLQPPVLKTG